MTHAEQIVRWNQWYDGIPPDWRFQFVLWPLLALGTINILLSLWVGFPFALLVMLGILFFTVVRVPYVAGWIIPAEPATASDTQPPKFQIEGASWIVGLNRRYDAMPEARQFWIMPTVLLIAGGINMLLTIGNGFPFGLLFLLALLALVAIRAPYTAGWFKPTEAIGDGIRPVGPYTDEIEHTPMSAIASEPPQPFVGPGKQHSANDLPDKTA